MSTPFWVAGKPASSPNTTVIRDPFDGSLAGEHDVPGAEDVERAVRAAPEVSAETAALPAHVRADALDHVSRTLDARRDELAELITGDPRDPRTGVFTADLRTAFAASAALRVGGVVVGDVPSFRADQMSYGGVKDSGVGREGPASAMADFTEEQVTVFTGLPI